MNWNELSALDHEYVWHPFTQMKDWVKELPLFIERGEGNYLIDLEGRRYFDGISSLWANLHGHNHPVLNEALQGQLSKIAHSTMLGLANVPATLFAKSLIDVAPASLRKVFFSDTGSAANEIALKMAYQYWQLCGQKNKKRFIKLDGSYHGDTIGAVSLGGIQVFHDIFSPFLFDTFSIPSPFVYHSDFTSETECMDYSLSLLEKILKEQQEEIIGVFTESYVQGAVGMIVFPKGFMKEIARLCKEHSVLLILDEVATGFGRTGRLFACEEDGILPDILTLGKGITGGYMPLAATLTSEEIYNVFLGDYSEYRSFFHGHTYTGNPLACSVGRASLKLLCEEGFFVRLDLVIQCLTKCLKKLWTLDHVGDIRQKGLMVGIELVENKKTKEAFKDSLRIGHRVAIKMRDYGVIIRSLGDVVVLMPPLSTTQDEMRFLVDKVYLCIDKITSS